MSKVSLGIAILTVAAVLAGCGGRSPNAVSQFQPGDEDRSCDGLRAEISSNENEIATLLPDEDATGKNVALGVSGAFFIVPLFFMDFKDAEGIEVRALQRRNSWLRQVAAQKNCEVPPSKFLEQVKACSEAKNADKPWIGEWAAKTGDDILAVEMTEFQINGQFITRGGVFEVSGRIDDNGGVEALIEASWAQAALKGTFPNLDARLTTGENAGGLNKESATRFVMCLS